MRPAPIPDWALWPGARRTMVHPPADVTPPGSVQLIEALVECDERPDEHRISVRCIPDAGDVEALADGGALWITFLGAMPIWGMQIAGPDCPQPPAVSEPVPGQEGTIGPGPARYGRPHVYARDVQSGAGNCVCGRTLGDYVHTEAAPGVPIPGGMRQ